MFINIVGDMIGEKGLCSDFGLSYPNVAVPLQARHGRIARTTKTITTWKHCTVRTIDIFMSSVRNDSDSNTGGASTRVGTNKGSERSSFEKGKQQDPADI